MPESATLQISARELAAAIRAGDITPLEAVDAHIRRIEEVNGTINAVVADRFDAAYGRTNNPCDPGRTAGGSSGGEAAIVGAGGSAFGVGADIGGSIRMPAAFCGVYGHKPTAGLVPLTGQHPVYGDVGEATARSPYLVTGPLARSARDLALLLRVMAGPDGIDPNADLLGGDGVMITPVHPSVAPRHHGPVLHPFDFLYTAFFNALRMPATAVPFGFDASGLPLAVQVAAARGRDHLTIAAAVALEASQPAWRPAPVRGAEVPA